MQKILNIDSNNQQEHILIYNNEEIRIDIYFSNVTNSWYLDVTYKGITYYGIRLVCGVLLLNKNLPFDFVVNDVSNEQLDPYFLTDFESGRIELYFVNDETLKAYRS